MPQRTRTCTVEGCTEPHNAKGYCLKHYMQWRRTGDPLGHKIRSVKTCEVEGCDRRSRRNGLCDLHSQRQKKHGTSSLPPKPSIEDRFWSFVDKTDTCWSWTGAKSFGYGQFTISQVHHRAHRWSYEHFVGPIPEGMFIDHMCHNPSCVNPAHLRIATPSQNTRNQRAEGRKSRTGHIGVAPSRSGKGYIAHITVNDKQEQLGRFNTIAEAAKVAREERICRFDIPPNPCEGGAA